MKDLVLVDIDHVLANSFWRDGMIGGPGGWESYHKASEKDEPVKELVRMVRALYRDSIQVYCITTRPERWRILTTNWMLRHNFFVTDILMRADDDYRPTPQVKLDLAKPYFDRLLFLIDDRDDVCSVFRAEGIVVLQAFISKSNSPHIPPHLETDHGVNREVC